MNKYIKYILRWSWKRFVQTAYILTQEYSVIHAFYAMSKAYGESTVFIRISINYLLDMSYTIAFIQICPICLFVDGQALILASVYCSPSSKLASVYFDLLFYNLSGRWIIDGDFNTKHQICGSQRTFTRGRDLAKVLHHHYKAISNGEPTYWPIDHRYCCKPEPRPHSTLRGTSLHPCWRTTTHTGTCIHHLLMRYFNTIVPFMMLTSSLNQYLCLYEFFRKQLRSVDHFTETHQQYTEIGECKIKICVYHKRMFHIHYFSYWVDFQE